MIVLRRREYWVSILIKKKKIGVQCLGKMKNKEVEQEHIETQERLNKMLSEHGLMKEDYKIVAIGYLSIDEEFEKGEVSTSFLTKLHVLCNEGLALGSAGCHVCEFCEGDNKATSSSEKELVDKENKIKYLFPKMIFHYITEHKFKPSNEFIEFVMRS